MGCGGGCGCAPCGSSSSLVMRAAAGDPVALKLLALGKRQTIGGFLPDVVWASDVEEYKKKIDPDFRATDSAAKACAALPAGVLAGWSSRYAAWRAFADEPQSFWGASNGWELAHQFEKELLDWQTKIEGSGCALHSPKVKPPERDDAPDLSWVKWLGIAVAVVGVAYVASPLVTAAGRAAR